jgi:hypothetical protein
LNAPVSLVTVCASASLFVQWTVVPALIVTICGPKAKLRIVTESEATGFAVGEDGTEDGIPLMPDGIAVGSADGDPDVPAKPASLWPVAGEIAALADVLLLLPHAASSTVPAAAVVVAAARHRGFQRY